MSGVGGVGIVEERKRRERLGERLISLSGDLMVVAKNVSEGIWRGQAPRHWIHDHEDIRGVQEQEKDL